jgi:hypothetical protein
MAAAINFADLLPRTDEVEHLIAETLANGGGSFFPMYLDSLITEHGGYMVSINPGRGIVLPLDEFSPSRVSVWIANNRTYIDNANYNGTVLGHGFKLFGTWVNDGMVHLDVTTLVNDLDSALRLGREHNQLAIYDLANGCDITINPESSALSDEMAELARLLSF